MKTESSGSKESWVAGCLVQGSERQERQLIFPVTGNTVLTQHSHLNVENVELNPERAVYLSVFPDGIQVVMLQLMPQLSICPDHPFGYRQVQPCPWSSPTTSKNLKGSYRIPIY